MFNCVLTSCKQGKPLLRICFGSSRKLTRMYSDSRDNYVYSFGTCLPKHSGRSAQCQVYLYTFFIQRYRRHLYVMLLLL